MLTAPLQGQANWWILWLLRLMLPSLHMGSLMLLLSYQGFRTNHKEPAVLTSWSMLLDFQCTIATAPPCCCQRRSHEGRAWPEASARFSAVHPDRRGPVTNKLEKNQGLILFMRINVFKHAQHARVIDLLQWYKCRTIEGWILLLVLSEVWIHCSGYGISF